MGAAWTSSSADVSCCCLEATGPKKVGSAAREFGANCTDGLRRPDVSSVTQRPRCRAGTELWTWGALFRRWNGSEWFCDEQQQNNNNIKARVDYSPDKELRARRRPLSARGNQQSHQHPNSAGSAGGPTFFWGGGGLVALGRRLMQHWQEVAFASSSFRAK